MIKADSFNREIFARTVWMEARGEGRDGLIAVAASILNRWKSGKWYGGRTLAAVCLKDQQFSCWNAAKDDKNREAMADLDENEADLIRCRAVVDGLLSGDIASNVGDATHYFAPNAVAAWPSWAKDENLVAELHGHRFYRGVA